MDKNMKQPLVTVIMPVYNTEKYLRQSINSILNQTFPDFEYIIIDDYSTDNSLDIINSYSDRRIKVIKNQKHLGVAASANIGFALAKGKYIVRMDADDISLPERLFQQCKYMEKHPKVDLCGSSIRLIGSQKIWKYPSGHERIKCRLLFNSPFAQPSLIFRKSTFEKNSLRYNDSFIRGEDYDLWARSIDKIKCSNIPRVLLFYRMTLTKKKRYFTKNGQKWPIKSRKKMLRNLGIVPENQILNVHQQISLKLPPRKKEDIREVANHIRNILNVNNKNLYFKEELLKLELRFQWFQFCYVSFWKYPIYTFWTVLKSAEFLI